MKFEYHVCEGFTIDELKNEVDLELENGWVCQGGIAVTPFKDKDNADPAFMNLIFHQAIVRVVKDQNHNDESARLLRETSPEELPDD